MTTYCKYCKTLITRRGEAVFCNNKCQAKFRTDTIITNWKNGLHPGGNIWNISGTIRKYMLIKANYACMMCGWDKINSYSNKSTLEVDHKDGNGENNNEENLIVLCLNCHSLTKTYRALNIGKGRHSKLKNKNLLRL
jgi:5-methylcytosine-specific restriction endonuclease McrA